MDAFSASSRAGPPVETPCYGDLLGAFHRRCATFQLRQVSPIHQTQARRPDELGICNAEPSILLRYSTFVNLLMSKVRTHDGPKYSTVSTSSIQYF